MDDLMKEAWALTNGDRRDAYGDPREVFAAYGDMWTALLRGKLRPDVRITGADVTLMMTALKLCRESQTQKRDNVVDAHGYLSLHSRVIAPAPPSTPMAKLLATLAAPSPFSGCRCNHDGVCAACINRQHNRRMSETMEAAYVCDHCKHTNYVRAEQHAPRLCSQTNCGGTQYPHPPGKPE